MNKNTAILQNALEGQGQATELGGRTRHHRTPANHYREGKDKSCLRTKFFMSQIRGSAVESDQFVFLRLFTRGRGSWWLSMRLMLLTISRGS